MATSMETKDLAFALKLAQPCLVSVEFIQVLSHYCFDGQFVYGYDNISAIVVECPTDLNCAVRGDTFLGLVGLAGEKTTLTQNKDSLEVVSGTSKTVLPILPPERFILQLPEEPVFVEFALPEDFLKGLAFCSLSVGNDPRRPEFTGITLRLGPTAVLYASDDTVLTKFSLQKGLGRKVREIILPKSVCDQIQGVAAALEAKAEDVTVQVLTSHIVVSFNTSPAVTIIGQLTEAKPADFEDTIKSCATTNPKVEMPEGFDSAVAKVILMLAKGVDRKCTLHTKGKALWVHGEGPMGRTETKFDVRTSLPDVTVNCSPDHLTTIMPYATHLVTDTKAVQLLGERVEFYAASKG